MSSPEATAAADWLAGELDQGLLRYRTEYGPFTDHGMSIDAALALDEVGGHDQVVHDTATAIAEQLPSYTEFPSGKGIHVSAGGTAKALVLAQVVGMDPTSFGGADVVEALEKLVDDSGRIADSFPANNRKDADYANVIGQVYAARGLVADGSSQAEAVLGHLLAQQCEEGWFRLTFTSDPTAADQGCDADPSSEPSADVTALAVIHLSAIEDQDPKLSSVIDEATAWLAEQQRADGAVVAPSAAANANTTGLAGWALGRAGDADAAAAAADWLVHLQADSGAVAFDQASFDEVGRADIPALSRSQWLLATAQAVPALKWHTN